MFGRQKIAILSILLGCTSAIADNYPKNPDIDIINYIFQIVLSDNVDVIDVEATIDFIFRKKGMSVLSLDFVSISDELEGKGMCVLDVTENGEPVNFKYGSDTLEVYLATSDENNEHKQVIITYKGIPATGLIIAPNKHGDRTFFSRN